MLAILFLLLTTATGYLIVRQFFPSLSLVASTAAGWIIGLLLSTWLLLLSISVLGYDGGIATSAIICFALSLFVWSKTNWKFFITQKISTNLALFLVIWGVLFFSLFYRSSLRQTSDGYYTSPYTYGDIALHSTMINYLTQQSKFSLQHPLVSQDVIRYPFLINFHSAILVRLGLSIQLTLILVGMLTILSLLVLLFEITSKLSKHRAVPWIASLLYFFNGGLGWWLLVKDAGSWPNLMATLRRLPFDYTNLEPEQLFWTNITTTHVLPQRGFMIGLAVVLLCLYLFQESWRAKKIQLRQLVLISIIIGSSALFHSHTFIFLSVLYLWLIGWAVWYQKIGLKAAVLSALPIFVLGGMQLAYIFDGNHYSFIQLQLGWKAQNNFVEFWLRNMGLDLAVLLIGTAVFFRTYKKENFAKLLILPSLGVYILCNIFIFQPNDWDNMKFLSLAFLAPSILTGVVIGQAMNMLGRKIVLGVFVILATISGVLSVMYVQQNDWLLSSRGDIAIAAEIKKITPSDSLFLTSEAHNHPIPMLSGRPVVLGYKGWLWTHGVEYSELDRQVQEIYSGAENTDSLIKQLGIEYIFIGDQERTSFLVNHDYFAERFPVVLQKNNVTIYKVD